MNPQHTKDIVVDRLGPITTMTEVHGRHETRSESPSSTASPTPALSAFSDTDCSISTASSYTSASSVSQTSERQCGKRRGYARPQATLFAESARNRDSVMSLGSIAHVQHYFARTGLLDGKGAQLAQDSNKSPDSNNIPVSHDSSHRSLFNRGAPVLDEFPSFNLDSMNITTYADTPSMTPPHQKRTRNCSETSSIPDLSPTVSTYKQKIIYVPPPPNLAVLRRELIEALEDAIKTLGELEPDEDDPIAIQGVNIQTWQTPPASPSAQGWHQIQGMHVLDLVTLAIRAAKNYYTSHEEPRRLYAIKSERQIRSELYTVLEVLKKLAARNFAGGIRQTEIASIAEWICGVSDLVDKDEEAEKQEAEQRQKWSWQEDIWQGRNREREWLFLQSFDDKPDSLPQWPEPDETVQLPNPFLLALRSGLRLVLLHNEMVRSSRRPFGDIKFFHTDTAKPYRCAENLRFWIKAAELRWDVHLALDVNALVRGEEAAAWEAFDKAVLKWCGAVRGQITAEWREHQDALRMQRPLVRMDPGPEYAIEASW